MHTPGEGCAPGALQQTVHPAPTLGQKFPLSALGVSSPPSAPHDLVPPKAGVQSSLSPFLKAWWH